MTSVERQSVIPRGASAKIVLGCACFVVGATLAGCPSNPSSESSGRGGAASQLPAGVAPPTLMAVVGAPGQPPRLVPRTIDDIARALAEGRDRTDAGAGAQCVFNGPPLVVSGNHDLCVTDDAAGDLQCARVLANFTPTPEALADAAKKCASQPCAGNCAVPAKCLGTTYIGRHDPNPSGYKTRSPSCPATTPIACTAAWQFGCACKCQ
jgi:hypothetical protein